MTIRKWAGLPAVLAALVVCGVLFTGCAKKNLLSPKIQLITSYTQGDAALAEIEGALYTINPQAQLSELLSGVDPADVHQTSYLIDQAAINFPGGVIFMVAIDSKGAAAHASVLVRTKLKKYYVAPDDGVLSFVLAREGLDRAWVLDKPEFYRANAGATPFQGIDVIAPIAARLTTATGNPEQLGTLAKTIETFPVNLPHSAGQTVGGEVVYIDSEGTLVTNIPPNFAPWLKEGNLLKFTLGKQTFNAPLVDSLTDIKVGHYAAVFSAEGRLQILVNKGSAARVFNAAVGDTFIIHP